MRKYTYRYTATQHTQSKNESVLKGFYAGSIEVKAINEQRAVVFAENAVIKKIGGSPKEFNVQLKLKEVI